MTPPVNLNEYKRLEFLGDRVLNLIVSHYLYEKFPDYSEGDLTKKLRFASNENLDEIVERFNEEFKTELAIFKRDYKPDDPELSADAVEAFIGKYYLDHKFEASKNHFEKLFAKEIDAFDPNTDYISTLQEYTQQNKRSLPVYEKISDKMIETNRHEFCVRVFIDGVFFGKGVGSSIQNANKQAAYKALKKLGNNL